MKVNARKTGVGRPWERKFLGFRITRKGQIEVAPESLKRLRLRVRQLWDARQNLSSLGLRDQWRQHIRGWWGYYRLAEWRRPVWRLEGWIPTCANASGCAGMVGEGVSGDCGLWGCVSRCFEWPTAVEEAGESPGTQRCTRP